ncbi:hypothetical protein [Paenibacillus sp.]|uniref:hypothetical protein n=1 Tax=Paenibacillus TaxID=44249 RepID=UPI0035662234
METGYHILQPGTIRSSPYIYFTAELTHGELEAPVGVVRGLRLHNVRIDQEASFVRLSTGTGVQVRLYVDLNDCPDQQTTELLRESHSGEIRLDPPARKIFVNLHKHKYILFVDEKGILCSIPLLLLLAKQGIQTEVYYVQSYAKDSPKTLKRYAKSLDIPVRIIREWKRPSLSLLLAERTIDTQLVVICRWPLYNNLVKLARELGFAKEDIEGYDNGDKEESVFCVRCYKLQRKPVESETSCLHCGASLSISNHYSERLEAYLGYVLCKE